MKKKLLTLLLTGCLSASLLTGCGNNDDYDDYDDQDYSDEEYEDESDSDDSGDLDDTDGEDVTVSEVSVATKSIASDAEEGTWTILIYMCGTDLESEGGDATENIEEIMQAEPNDNINIVIETGGCKEWWYEDTEIPTDCLSRYVVEDSELNLVDTEELASMTDEDTLADFMTWGVENYPAEKYMAVLWDHGGGSVDGVICDEIYEDDDSLSVKAVAEAIGEAGQTFEVVGFDACLMSTLENASALCPYSRYMVASEETEPAGGWDYTAWLNYLSSDTTMSGAALGTKIVDSFYDKCDENDEEYDCTLAVTDLSRIPALVESFNNMAGEMKGYTDDVSSIKVISGAFKSAENYGGNCDAEGYSDMVDLGDLILNAEGVLSATGEKCIDDLLSAVVYHKNGESRSKGEGLSVYVPLSNDEYNFEQYAANAAISADYLAFLEELYQFEVPEDVDIVIPVAAKGASDSDISTESVDMDSVEAAPTIDYRNQKITYSLKVNDDGFLEADITGGADLIDAVKCNLYYYDPDEKIYYDLGSDYNVYVNDDWTKMEDNFDNTWIFINGNLAVMQAGNTTDDYIEYSVPILLNDERTNLRMLYRYDTEKFEIVGLWDGIGENGQASRTAKKIKNGDRIDFVIKGKSGQNGSEEEYVIEGFTVSGKLTVTEDDLGDGTYGYSMEFEDIFGNSTETRWAEINVEDGEIEVTL